MFKVFYGDDRVATESAIKSLLGPKYEVFEGEILELQDLPSIFLGTSLFNTEQRQILLKDVSENASVWEKIPDYLETSHEVVLWEKKLDKRSVVYKRLKEAGVELREFPERQKPEAKLVFGILETALRDGARAVQMVEQIELTQDPYMFFGLMVTQALKRFEARQGIHERQMIKELAKLDLQMKTTALDPWLLVKSFLLRVGQL